MPRPFLAFGSDIREIGSIDFTGINSAGRKYDRDLLHGEIL